MMRAMASPAQLLLALFSVQVAAAADDTANLRGAAAAQLSQCPTWSFGTVDAQDIDSYQGNHSVTGYEELQAELEKCSTFCSNGVSKAGSQNGLDVFCAAQRDPDEGSLRCALRSQSPTSVVTARRLKTTDQVESYACIVQKASIFETNPNLTYALVAMAFAGATLVVNFIVVGLLCRYLGAARQLETMTGGDAQLKPAAEFNVPAAAGRSTKQSQSQPLPVVVNVPAGRRGTSAGDFHSFGEYDAVELGGAAARGLLDGSPADLDFNGVWECIATWGLEEFLVAMNTPKLRRIAALRVPWPTWQITQDGDEITLIIRSSFGVQTESFKADGSEYMQKDIEGNTNTCKAYFQDTGFVIERVGAKGRAFERRMMKPDGTIELLFEMQGCPVKWGRKFRRK